MKKTFILFYFLFAIVFAFGQNNCGATVYNITSSELQAGSNIYNLMWEDFGYTNPDPTGYVFGHNTIETYEYAEKFSNSTAKVISQIELGACKATSNSSNAFIVLKIWNDNQGVPGTCIYANYYSISSFASDVANGYSTIINISPVQVNSTYYVGFQIFYETPQDEFALYAAIRAGSTPSSTTYIKNASGTSWIDFPSLGTGYNSTSMLIGTVTCDVPIDCNFIASKSPVVAGDSINFYNRSLGNPTSFSWSFEQGTPATSIVTNPTNIVYNTVGSYTVSLNASSPTNGQNTVFKNNYIKVIPTTPDVSTNCNTLYNLGSSETVDIIEWDNQEGFLLGHNAWGNHEFAEKFTNNQTKFLTQINLGIATVQSGSANSIVSFKVWDEQGGLPGNLLGTCSAALSAVTGNQTMAIIFPTPIEVTGNFFVGFEIFRQNYNDIFSVSSSAQRSNENTYPTTTYIRSSVDLGNAWTCVNTYGVYSSMNLAATLCSPNNLTVNADFTASQTSSCIGTNINFTDQSTGTVTSWSWNFGDGSTSTLQNPSHSYSNSGQYTVTLSINNGADTEIKTNYITINQSPLITFSPSTANIICTTPTSVTAQGGSTFQWSNGLGANATATISTPGTYYVTVTSAANCTASNSITVGQSSNTVNVSITPSNPQIDCIGTPITLTASGTSSYVWSNEVNNSQTQVNAAGTYTVTGTDSYGCTGQSSVTVTVLNNDASVTITPPSNTTINCNVSSIQITANGNGTYSWNNSMGNSSTIQVSTAGTYIVTVTSASGCTATDQITISSNTTVPTVSFNYSANELNCSTSAITITAAPSGMNYNWYNGNNTSSITETTSGNYSVTVTNPTNGCQGQGLATISENYTPTTATLQTNPIGVTELTCSQTSIELTATPTSNNGPFSYHWNYGLGNNQNVTVSSAGNFAVTITGANGCTATFNQNITNNQTTPDLSLSASASNFDCHTNQITLTAIGDGIFTWSNGLGSNENVTITNPGTYSVTINDENGCTASGQITIGSIPPPSISISDIYVCDNNSVQLPAPQNYTVYEWTFNGNTVTQATESGYYTIEVTDNSFCSATEVIQVFFSTSPEITSTNTTPCNSPTSADGTATVSVDQNNVTYAWSNGANGQSISNLTPGTYTVTITNEFNCSVVAQVEVSFLTSISENVNNEVMVYPNPNNGNFVIDFDNSENILSYQIVSVEGKVIFEKDDINTNSKEEIKLNLKPGTYFISIISKEKQETKQFIVIDE